MRPQWLRHFFPGYLALVMATGIVAVAAAELHQEILAWPLVRSPFLQAIPPGLFWVALLVWLLAFIGLCGHLMRARRG